MRISCNKQKIRSTIHTVKRTDLCFLRKKLFALFYAGVKFVDRLFLFVKRGSVASGGRGRPRADQSRGPVAYQIRPARLDQSGVNEIVVFRLAVLQKGALLPFFLPALRHVNRLEVVGIQPRVIHTSGFCGRRGVKILHLLRHRMDGMQIDCKVNGVVDRRTGMGRDKVWHEILLLADTSVDGFVLFFEAQIHPERGFVHIGKHLFGTMLGRNFELTADVMFHQLAEKGLILIVHNKIKANAASDKHLFDLGKHAERTQDIQILLVMDF